jgi:hypothetical protein
MEVKRELRQRLAITMNLLHAEPGPHLDGIDRGLTVADQLQQGGRKVSSEMLTHSRVPARKPRSPYGRKRLGH